MTLSTVGFFFWFSKQKFQPPPALRVCCLRRKAVSIITQHTRDQKVLFVFRWICHAKCLESQPQNVLFSLQRIQQSASGPMTVTGEKSAAHQSGIGESSTQIKQQRFAVPLIWIFPPDCRTTREFVSHATNAAKSLFLCHVQNKGWSKYVIFNTVSWVDVSARMTFLWVRHSAQTTKNSQLRTSKCNFTSCKATGHLPCFFTDWDDWGQLAVLRGNTINYTPHGRVSERLTTHTCRSSWKRNICDRGKQTVERAAERERETTRSD